MRHKSLILCGTGLAAFSVLVATGRSKAQTVDGTLSAGEGYTLAATQTQATSSLSDSGGGPQPLPASDATATSTGNFTQLSNAYTNYNPSTNVLSLFIGGSINTNDGGVSHYVIAINTGGSGAISNLNNVAVINGSVHNVNNPTATALDPGDDGLNRISFDEPATGLLVLEPNTASGATTGTSAYTGFTDLTGGGHSLPSLSVAYNGGLQNIPVGTGASGDPGFAGAHTGTELSFSLTDLGYVAGSNIPVALSIFTTNGGNDGRTNNQTLAPFIPNVADQSSGYDYTYIDSTEVVNGVAVPGRQFTGPDYGGDQFFDVPGTPEPASLSLLGLSAIPLLRRRVRKIAVRG